ncbi:hypothetical protein RJT34_03539 [Clitoria ternatea]|uniref:Uncharacterized protein n=1 Tax=Clitoria ternatea TaxID=43366 RepID=A0AAN9KMD7_CLITE
MDDDDASRVTHSLDSLWFYDNIFTSTPLIHSKGDNFQIPNTPFLLNQQDDGSPTCDKFDEEVKCCRRRGSERRKWNKLGEVRGLLKFHEESYKYKIQRLSYKMRPIDADVAMKQLLRSWAYAVACTCTVK